MLKKLKVGEIKQSTVPAKSAGTVYLISYDAKLKRQEYEDLYQELDRMGAEPILESLWAARIADTTPVAIGNRILPYLPGSDDALFVVPIGDGASFAYLNIKTDFGDL